MSVVLLSGGVDSLVLLAREISLGVNPVCISFDYGQKHIKELTYAKKISDYYKVEHHIYKIPDDPLGGSSISKHGCDVPKGIHYTDTRQSPTIVPGRNLVFLSLCVAYAMKNKIKKVLYGAHAGDRTVYLDCRNEFIENLNVASEYAYGVTIEAPFLNMSKKDIVDLGMELKSPFGLSWSCYDGEVVPCWKCGACIERLESGLYV